MSSFPLPTSFPSQLRYKKEKAIRGQSVTFVTNKDKVTGRGLIGGELCFIFLNQNQMGIPSPVPDLSHSLPGAEQRRTRVFSGEPTSKRKAEDEAELPWTIFLSRITSQIRTPCPLAGGGEKRHLQEGNVRVGKPVSSSQHSIISSQLFTQLQWRTEWAGHQYRIWTDVTLVPSLLSY